MNPCKKCGSSRRGKHGDCLDCKKLDANKRYYKNHERLKQAQRDYNKSEKGIISRIKRQRQMPGWIRFKHNLKACFGITVEEYAWMAHRQDFKCACCRCNLMFDKHTHVDHCHETGTVRGLLCHHCNTSIGLLGENTETLRSLIAYLETHNAD